MSSPFPEFVVGIADGDVDGTTPTCTASSSTVVILACEDGDGDGDDDDDDDDDGNDDGAIVVDGEFDGGLDDASVGTGSCVRR